MKEMIYSLGRKIEILHAGNYKGFDFCIMNLGTHPTAYVRLSEDHNYYNKHYDEIDIDCHYGLTFGKVATFNEIEGYWIGWDYAHCGDYVGHNIRFKGTDLDGERDKKWTTQEIYEEVKNVIEQLKEG